MNHEQIRSCLVAAGYDAELTDGSSTLTLGFKVGERRISLVHKLPNELLRVPKFLLADGYTGKLAHVGVDRNGGPGEVCIADVGSTAVNTDHPELVYLETVREHVALLTRLIENPAYNRDEQLREFGAHWEILCRTEHGGSNELFVAWDGQEAEGLQVKQSRATSGSDLRKTHIALTNAQQPWSVCGTAEWDSRQISGKALGVPLSCVEPAPATREELLAWYFSTIDHVVPTGRHEWKRLKKKSSLNFWLVFSAPIPGGETMFAIRWRSRSLGRLPSSEEAARAGRWTAVPLPSQVAVAEVTSPAGWWVAGPEEEIRSARRLRVGWKRACAAADIGWGWSIDGLRSRDIFGREPLPPCSNGEGHRPVQERGACTRSGPETPVGGGEAFAKAAGRVAGPGGAAAIRFGGDRDRFADGRTGLRGILLPRSLGRGGDQLLAGRLRNRRPCNPGDAWDERMLALRLCGPRDPHARTHVEPELPEAGAGRDAQPRGLRYAVLALQRDRGKLQRRR